MIKVEYLFQVSILKVSFLKITSWKPADSTGSKFSLYFLQIFAVGI